MNYWEGPARWINAMLLIVVGFVGLDTLFQLLGALDENFIVRFVGRVAGFFLTPFEGMFVDQEYLLTAIIAVLGYSLLAGIILAIIRSVEASHQRQRRPEDARAAESAEEPDETRRL